MAQGRPPGELSTLLCATGAIATDEATTARTLSRVSYLGPAPIPHCLHRRLRLGNTSRAAYRQRCSRESHTGDTPSLREVRRDPASRCRFTIRPT